MDRGVEIRDSDPANRMTFLGESWWTLDGGRWTLEGPLPTLDQRFAPETLH